MRHHLGKSTSGRYLAPRTDWWAACAVATIVLIAPPPGAAQSPAAADSLRSLDRAYTEAQAVRGAQVFGETCAQCHAKRVFSDAAFRRAWNGRPVYSLFRLISTTMPDDRPGSLQRGAYVDVLAYVFTLNGVPAGDVELPDGDDALKTIRMDLPTDSTRRAPPDTQREPA